MGTMHAKLCSTACKVSLFLDSKRIVLLTGHWWDGFLSIYKGRRNKMELGIFKDGRENIGDQYRLAVQQKGLDSHRD